jgi:hypothetical protein
VKAEGYETRSAPEMELELRSWLAQRELCEIGDARDTFKPAAERHWERLVALYQRCLE